MHIDRMTLTECEWRTMHHHKHRHRHQLIIIFIIVIIIFIVTMQATAARTATSLIMDNGLLRREFTLTPAFGTTDLRVNAQRSRGGEQSAFRSVHPEARITLDGVPFDVGGLTQTGGFLAYANRSELGFASNPAAFAFHDLNITTVVAPFPWTPGTRHSPPDVSWPPKGVSLPCWLHCVQHIHRRIDN